MSDQLSITDIERLRSIFMDYTSQPYRADMDKFFLEKMSAFARTLKSNKGFDDTWISIHIHMQKYYLFEENGVSRSYYAVKDIMEEFINGLDD